MRHRRAPRSRTSSACFSRSGTARTSQARVAAPPAPVARSRTAAGRSDAYSGVPPAGPLARRGPTYGFTALRRLPGSALVAQRLKATWRGSTLLFPALDSYCCELFGTEQYEPEIFAFLSRLRDEPFGFVDGGANLGYWSVLLSGDW